MRISILFLIVLFMVVNTCLLAADLKPFFDYPTAQTLPKGVRNVRMKGMFVEAIDKFDNSGKSVPLGDSLNADITFSKILDGKKDPIERGRLEEYLKFKGLDDFDEAIGYTSGVANVNANIVVPVMAYGITENLTVAVAVPVVTTKVNVDTGFISADKIKELYDELVEDGRTYDAEKLIEDINRPISLKLNDYNYKQLENEESTEMGDIKVVTKYKLLEDNIYTMTLVSDITLPTGKQASINKALDVPSGDGQLDVGFGVVVDWNLGGGFTFSHLTGYTAQFSDTVQRRVPEHIYSSLTPDVDDSIKRDLGDIMYAQVGMAFSFLGGFFTKTAYGIQYKGRDSYDGSKYNQQRYRWMETNTEQNIQSMQVALGYTTIELFKKKMFPVPLEINVNYSTVVAGKNVTKDPLLALEFAMFF